MGTGMGALDVTRDLGCNKSEDQPEPPGVSAYKEVAVSTVITPIMISISRDFVWKVGKEE